MQLRFRCANTDSEHFGDFLMLETFDIVQHKNGVLVPHGNSVFFQFQHPPPNAGRYPGKTRIGGDTTRGEQPSEHEQSTKDQIFAHFHYV